jgi:RHS repeat-associated protein
MQGAGGVGGLLAVTDSTGTYYPTYDGNGNISEYLNSTGAVAAHYEYDPFGKTTVATGPKANDFAHRFSTKPLDAATGLYYYGYRFYHPNTGRWPSRDPIEEEGGLNLYSFGPNSPLDGYDVLGEWWFRRLLDWLAKRPGKKVREAHPIGGEWPQYGDRREWKKAVGACCMCFNKDIAIIISVGLNESCPAPFNLVSFLSDHYSCKIIGGDPTNPRSFECLVGTTEIKKGSCTF